MKKFERTIEDFACEYCGVLNEGDGYTNHCKACLWSKHVDINPGDRSETCKGLMKPISVEQKAGEYVITHQCSRCNFTRKKIMDKQDDFEALLKIIKGV